MEVYITHMRYIPRRLTPILQDASRHFPAVVVTGPRRAGRLTFTGVFIQRDLVALFRKTVFLAEFASRILD